MHDTLDYIDALQKAYMLPSIPQPATLSPRDAEIAEVLRDVARRMIPALKIAPEILILLPAKYRAYQFYISMYVSHSGWRGAFLEAAVDSAPIGLASFIIKPMKQ